MLLSLGLDWPNSLPGLNNLKIWRLSYLWCCKSCGHSPSEQRPGRWKQSQRPALLCLWSLNKAIYFVSLASTKSTIHGSLEGESGKLYAWEGAAGIQSSAKNGFSNSLPTGKDCFWVKVLSCVQGIQLFCQVDPQLGKWHRFRSN